MSTYYYYIIKLFYSNKGRQYYGLSIGLMFIIKLQSYITTDDNNFCSVLYYRLILFRSMLLFNVIALLLINTTGLYRQNHHRFIKLRRCSAKRFFYLMP